MNGGKWSEERWENAVCLGYIQACGEVNVGEIHDCQTSFTLIATDDGTGAGLYPCGYYLVMLATP